MFSVFLPSVNIIQQPLDKHARILLKSHLFDRLANQVDYIIENFEIFEILVKEIFHMVKYLQKSIYLM